MVLISTSYWQAYRIHSLVNSSAHVKKTLLIINTSSDSTGGQSKGSQTETAAPFVRQPNDLEALATLVSISERALAVS